MIFAPVPALDPVAPVSTVVQLKVAPVGVEVNAIPVVSPEQIVCAVGVAIAVGFELTLMTTSIGVPTQPFKVGVTVYVAEPPAAESDVNVWLIAAPVPAVAPLTFDCVTVQSKVAPAGVELNEIPVTSPEQIVSVVGVAVTVGIGLIVITTSIGNPGQPANVGVTVYVVVPTAAPDALNVCAIVDPVPAVAPLEPDSVTVHANVAPAGVELNAIPVDVPEQIVWLLGVATTTGVGFTVITTSIGVPTQVPKVGVTVYVAVPVAAPVVESV